MLNAACNYYKKRVLNKSGFIFISFLLIFAELVTNTVLLEKHSYQGKFLFDIIFNFSIQWVSEI